MDNGECRYRGRVIGWLVRGSDGFLKYVTNGRREVVVNPDNFRKNGAF